MRVRQPWFVMGIGAGLAAYEGVRRYGKARARRRPWESRAARVYRILDAFDWRSAPPPISAVSESDDVSEANAAFDMLAARRDAA